MNGPVQLLCSGAVAIVVYALLTIDVRTKNETNGGGVSSGLDPNWQNGVAPTKPPPITYTSGLPSCQIWDPVIGLFAGDKTTGLDKDQQTCFTNIPSTKLGRYVDATGNPTFNVEDPLSDPPSEQGVCTYQDFTTYPGFAAPNRSARLCFNSGTTAATTGSFFVRHSDNATFGNPLIQNSALLNNPLYVQPPPNQPFCENYSTFPRADGNPINLWQHTATSAPYDGDRNSCINKGYRYQDPSTKTLFYRTFGGTGDVIEVSSLI